MARRRAGGTPATTAQATGYVAGGISPIGQKRPHPTVLVAAALVSITGAIVDRVGRG